MTRSTPYGVREPITGPPLDPEDRPDPEQIAEARRKAERRGRRKDT